MEPIYLDYAATTPLDPRVLTAMLPYFSGEFGNPHSIHRWGQRAEHAVEAARAAAALVLHCRPDEIIFTSGGSEADNLAVRGAALAERERRGANHLITTPVEHAAVLATMRQLRDHFGFDLTLLPVDATGRVSPAEVAAALRPDTAVVAVCYACNEIGTVQPLPEIAAACRAAGARLHTDAVQAASQLDLNVQALGVDSLALGAHKLYGPKGVGLLYARAGRPLLPMQTGGDHEAARRAGTHNVPGVVGLAEALRLTDAERAAHNARFTALRDRLIDGVLAAIPHSALTGHRTERLPNHASFVLEGVDGNELLMHLDLADIGASSGSACKTGDPEPSEVLLALGLPRAWALGSLRLTLGRATTDDHIDRVLAVLPGLVTKLRAALPA
ncbi:MAG: cysteine desulfurase [Anaerolineales bacterium]|nr:cysteine desulfurase [Anaerolineales bacterium]